VSLVVPWEVPVDGSVDVGVVEVAELCWLPDVEPLAGWPVSVGSVPIEAAVPVVDVVVDVFAEPSIVPPALSVGLLELSPPGLRTVEVPAVAREFTSTVTVVIVVEVEGAVWVADDVDNAFADACGPPASCDWVAGVMTGVEGIGAPPLESEVVAGAKCSTGAGGGGA
jgi:hypothetical protein